MAKKIPKEYKSGQSILVKLSGGRIVEARVNHLIQDRDATKLQVDFGHDETALIEHWQVLAARGLKQKGRPNGNKAGPAPGGVTAFFAFPSQQQPIETIMAAVEVSVVALEHVCRCPGAIKGSSRLPSVSSTSERKKRPPGSPSEICSRRHMLRLCR